MTKHVKCWRCRVSEVKRVRIVKCDWDNGWYSSKNIGEKHSVREYNNNFWYALDAPPHVIHKSDCEVIEEPCTCIMEDGCTCDEKQEFTKADLKTGMVVELRNGLKYRVEHNAEFSTYTLYNSQGYRRLSVFNSNLTHGDDKDFDIVKVERQVKYFEVIWQRPLDPKEEQGYWVSEDNRDALLKQLYIVQTICGDREDYYKELVKLAAILDLVPFDKPEEARNDTDHK